VCPASPLFLCFLSYFPPSRNNCSSLISRFAWVFMLLPFQNYLLFFSLLSKSTPPFFCRARIRPPGLWSCPRRALRLGGRNGALGGPFFSFCFFGTALLSRPVVPVGPLQFGQGGRFWKGPFAPFALPRLGAPCPGSCTFEIGFLLSWPVAVCGVFQLRPEDPFFLQTLFQGWPTLKVPCFFPMPTVFFSR